VFLNCTDNMPSWRTALVYKPTTNGSVYSAGGTSFNPSAETLSLAVNTAGLAPEENETYEIGTKWLLDDGRLTGNGAVFQIAKTNACVPDPNNSAFNVLGGNQRVRGFEIGMTGYLTDRWEIYTGYSFLNSKVVASTLPATVGQATGEHTAEHLQPAEHLSPAVVRPRGWRRCAVRRQPHRKFHTERNHRSD
jgi:catecholate siderophore receptor